MGFFKFLNPEYDDTIGHKPKIKQIPAVFLKLDGLFKGYSDKKPDYCPVFEFREGFWIEKKHSPDTPKEDCWRQSTFLLYIPEGPYYASLKNFAGKHRPFEAAELSLQTTIKEESIDFMQYSFTNAVVEGVSLNHELEHIELILGCDRVLLEIKNIDPVTKNVLGKSVSEIDMVRHKIC